jgi:hypothetical protein
MALTSDQMNIIAADELNGRKPRITGPEAEAFIESIQKDIELARKNGWQIEIPKEWDVNDGD